MYSNLYEQSTCYIQAYIVLNFNDDNPKYFCGAKYVLSLALSNAAAHHNNIIDYRRQNEWMMFFNPPPLREMKFWSIIVADNKESECWKGRSISKRAALRNLI